MTNVSQIDERDSIPCSHAIIRHLLIIHCFVLLFKQKLLVHSAEYVRYAISQNVNDNNNNVMNA